MWIFYSAHNIFHVDEKFLGKKIKRQAATTVGIASTLRMPGLAAVVPGDLSTGVNFKMSHTSFSVNLHHKCWYRRSVGCISDFPPGLRFAKVP